MRSVQHPHPPPVNPVKCISRCPEWVTVWQWPGCVIGGAAHTEQSSWESQSPGVYLPRKRRGRHKHSPRPDQETDKSSPSQSEASIQVTRSLSANQRPDQEKDKVQPSQGRRRYTGLCWIVQLRPGNTDHMFLKLFIPSTLGLPSLVTLLVLAFVFLVSCLLSMII